MTSVADVVEPGALQERAGEYLHRAGEVLRENGRVRIVDFAPTRVTAEVDDGGTRSVDLEVGDGQLRATCTCGLLSANGLCPHIVAVALETRHRAPNSH